MFLSRTVARLAVKRGHQVTALARGTHPVPKGVQLVTADREQGADAYRSLLASLADEQTWDAVLDVSRIPNQVESAVTALSTRTKHWAFVSTVSVYADHSTPSGNESDQLLAEWSEDQDPLEHYGEAKVSCEKILREALSPEQLLVARPGLICGPGDPSDRYGYWPARFARDNEPVLAPAVAASAKTQVIDVRDFAAWLLDGMENALAGTYDVVGDEVPMQTLLGAALEASGYRGQIRLAPEEWLLEQGVNYWAGEDSLPLWLPAEAAGMFQRDGSAARRVGLRPRPFDETLKAVLQDERSRGLTRERRAGLSAAKEKALIAELP